MLKNKYIKFSISIFLVVLALWIAVPKVFVHDLFHHNHSSINMDDETTVQSPQSTDDCEFEKYDKPVYFNIFKFVSNIAPIKHKQESRISESKINIPGISVLISLLRAPPITE